MKKVIGISLVLALASGVALAQNAEDGVQYKQKTTYDFDDDVVEGDLVRPDGEILDSAGKTKHSSLIKIRASFVPELLKSAEDI